MNSPLAPLLFIVIATFLAPDAQARWATLQDAEIIGEDDRFDVEINEDGSYETTTELTNRIVLEGGRRMANFTLPYNSRAGSLKILEAETINGDKRFPVDSEFIEDKPQASRAHGFDQHNLVTVAFPKVEIGSRIHFKWVEKVNEVPLPGHFSMRYRWGVDAYELASKVRFRSSRPLFVEFNDPQSKLDVKQEKIDGAYEVTATLKAPIYTRAVDEPWVSLNPKDTTWLVVSTHKTYAELGDTMGDKFEKLMVAKLPASFERILEKAKAKSVAVEQINTITSELAAEVRYMGDWRAVNGGWVPHDLETVAKMKFGDCKDFSVSTAAIMRRLGFEAQIAWVEREVQPHPYPQVAFRGVFNHAIVWAKDPRTGQTHWVDPTNFASFAQGVFEDIIGRPALVQDAKGSHLEEIPAGKPGESVQKFVTHVKPDASGDATVDARGRFEGRAASALTGALLKVSKEQMDHRVSTWLVEENRVKWKKIDDYDLSSRITSDVEFHMAYGERNHSLRTTAGPAFRLDQHNQDGLMRLDSEKRVSDYFLGHPRKSVHITHVDGVKVRGAVPPRCELKSPWVEATREIKQSQEGIIVSDTQVVVSSLLPIEDIKSARFRKFQKNLQKCFDRVLVVYRPLREPLAQGKKARDVSSVPMSGPEALSK